MPDGATTTQFVPLDLDASDWSNIEPLCRELMEREIDGKDALERWLIDRSELDAACSEARADLYINMTCHTDDEAAAGAWTSYLENTFPKLRTAAFELDTRQSKLMATHPLDPHRYGVLQRETDADVKLFREENVPIESELAKLDQKYDRVIGAMTVEFEGETRTLPQMGRFLEDHDRETRERAWRTTSERRLQDADTLDSIFDEMVTKRRSVATNAGFSNYRDYAFESMHRFDYTPNECEAFHHAVETHAVPFARELQARRQKNMSLERLRPWDTAVDEKGREPLRPFETGQELIEKTRAIFDRLDPELHALFATLGDDMGGSFDLESRKGKASGGYQYMRDRSRTPFIFMNAAGLHRDAETIIHEAGHAFHSLLCADEPLVHYRHAPIEFAEVASMAMELLTMPHWDVLYPDKEEANRARRKQIEGALAILPWIATIDAFQHWLYTNPGHTPEQRTEYWLSLNERFGAGLDWTGLEKSLEKQWQKQGHLYGVPFYYIEYGIAQLGALGIWKRSIEEGPARALALYKEPLTLGGSRPLPELFELAGVPFDFSADRIESLVTVVREELEKLPE